MKHDTDIIFVSYQYDDPNKYAEARREIKPMSGDFTLPLGTTVVFSDGSTDEWHNNGPLIKKVGKHGNKINVHSKTVFTLTKFFKNRRCQLITDGYGSTTNYGRGPVYAWHSSLQPVRKKEKNK